MVKGVFFLGWRWSLWLWQSGLLDWLNEIATVIENQKTKNWIEHYKNTTATVFCSKRQQEDKGKYSGVLDAFNNGIARGEGSFYLRNKVRIVQLAVYRNYLNEKKKSMILKKQIL